MTTQIISIDFSYAPDDPARNLEVFMKLKVVALVAVSVMLAANADAAERRRGGSPMTAAPQGEKGNQRMAGCGLGSMVVEKNEKWSQVAASFLNGTGFQTFAISFGTSGCTEDGVASAAREKDAFVEANLADLRRDVAAGEGEYLTGLASFYGCQGNGSASFGAALQRHQDEILGASADEASRVIDQAVVTEKAACQG